MDDTSLWFLRREKKYTIETIPSTMATIADKFPYSVSWLASNRQNDAKFDLNGYRVYISGFYECR